MKRWKVTAGVRSTEDAEGKSFGGVRLRKSQRSARKASNGLQPEDDFDELELIESKMGSYHVAVGGGSGYGPRKKNQNSPRLKEFGELHLWHDEFWGCFACKKRCLNIGVGHLRDSCWSEQHGNKPVP